MRKPKERGGSRCERLTARLESHCVIFSVFRKIQKISLFLKNMIFSESETRNFTLLLAHQISPNFAKFQLKPTQIRSSCFGCRKTLPKLFIAALDERHPPPPVSSLTSLNLVVISLRVGIIRVLPLVREREFVFLTRVPNIFAPYPFVTAEFHAILARLFTFFTKIMRYDPFCFFLRFFEFFFEFFSSFLSFFLEFYRGRVPDKSWNGH